MAGPRDLRAQVCRRVIGRSVLRTCISIFGFALPLVVFSTVLSAAQAEGRSASTNLAPQSKGVSLPVRIPVVDGNDIRFSRLSTAQGLSQTRVERIVEDNQGFIWLGTQYGLDRYDGYEYKVFTPDPARENSISCVYIHSLFKDRSGMLWIGCDDFLDRFDPIKETFTHYQIGGEAPGEVASPVGQINQDSAGLLWLATARGLFGLNPDTGQLIHYFHDSSNPLSLGNNAVKFTLEDSSGRFWVIAGGDLEEFDRNSGRVVLRIRLGEGPTSLFEDHLGILWVTYVTGGNGNSLAVLDRSTNRLIPYLLYDKGSGKRIDGGFMAMLEDQKKTLWFASLGEGLLKFDRDRQIFIRYRNHPSDLESLAEDRVISLCEDHEGNIWVGLHAREPNFFRTESSPFMPLSRNQNSPNSLGETFVNTVYEDHVGALWTGTTGALNRIDPRSGLSVSYPPPGPGLSTDIIAINEDTSGTIWVGTYGGGLSRFDRKTGHYKTYQHEPGNPSSLSNNVVSRLLIDHAGTMWIATWNGLDRFDPDTESFVTYKRDKKSDEERYFNITEDQTGSLWMGSPGAVNRFDPKTGQFTVYAYRAGDPKSLSSDGDVTSVYVGHSGAIWASTQNGLNKFNRESGTFTHYFMKDGLPTNNLSCILEDQSGKLWISTSRGLSRFDPVANTFTNYSTVDGLPGNDLTGWDACFKSRSGEMFFGGFSGGVAFFPDKVIDTSDPLPLVLTDFRLAGRTVEVGSHSVLEKSISYAGGVTLTHDNDIFSFTFAALTYFNPDASRYRYKLEGLEHNWTEVGSDRRVVTYTTLPPRTYTFRVQSATRQGAWGEPGLAFTITILPPWWETLWFRLLSGAFVLAIVGALYQLRLRKLAREFNVRLGERVSERTRIARELHDTMLQSFQGLMMQLYAVTHMLENHPEARQRVEKLALQASQAVTEGREAVQGMRSSMVIKNDLANALKTIGESLAAGQSCQSPVDFRVEVGGETRDLHPILRDEVYRLGCEAIRNAFQHSDAKRIEVEINYGTRQLRLRIRDNGKGIAASVLEEGRRSGHFGLPGMHERARSAGGKLNLWSAPGNGTEIELTLPASRVYTKPRTREVSS